MYQFVPHPRYILPWYFRIAFSDFFRQPLCSFTYYLDLPYHPVLYKMILHEVFISYTQDILLYSGYGI